MVRPLSFALRSLLPRDRSGRRRYFDRCRGGVRYATPVVTALDDRPVGADRDVGDADRIALDADRLPTRINLMKHTAVRPDRRTSLVSVVECDDRRTATGFDHLAPARHATIDGSGRHFAGAVRDTDPFVIGVPRGGDRLPRARFSPLGRSRSYITSVLTSYTPNEPLDPAK